MAYDNVVNALTGTKKVPANMKTFAEGPQAYANLDPSMAGMPGSAASSLVNWGGLGGFQSQNMPGNLRSQILQQWGGTGDWNQGGIDRADELAQILAARGITDLGQLNFREQEWTPQGEINGGDGGDGSYTTPEAQKGLVAFNGDKRLGYLGNSNNDGTIRPFSDSADDPGWRGDLKAAAWSARGRGNVSFVPVKGPDGKVVVRPVWGSSSKETYDDIRGAAMVGAAALGGYYAGGGSAAAGLSGVDAAMVDLAASGGLTPASMGSAGLGAASGGMSGGAAASGGLGAAELGANGAFLGEGVASGVPAWDAAAIKSAIGSGELGTAASYGGQVLQGGTALETLGSTLNPASSAAQTAAQTAAKSGGGGGGGTGGLGLRDAIPLVGAAATLASGGSVATPQVPDYVKAAIATGNAGKYNEQTPYGTVTWSLRPGADPMNPQPGDYVRSTNFSPEQQKLYEQNTANQTTAGQVGGRQLAELGSGRQAVQDALYRRATQYYDQNFGDQENQLRARLAAQGLNEGSEAFTRELRNFRQTRDAAYADATDRAIAGADQQENNAVARIVNILNMSKATTPTSGNSAGGAGTDLLSAANQAYTANLGASNAQAAASAQQQNAILQLVLGGMKYYGG